MNRINTPQGMETVYSAPSVEILDITVEKGFAESNYGDAGAAGDYLEPGNDYEL